VTAYCRMVEEGTYDLDDEDEDEDDDDGDGSK
jgi:hypothetical protein